MFRDNIYKEMRIKLHEMMTTPVIMYASQKWLSRQYEKQTLLSEILKVHFRLYIFRKDH